MDGNLSSSSSLTPASLDNGSGSGVGQQSLPTGIFNADNFGNNNSVIGADLAAQNQGSRSIYDRASDLITKGIPLTGAAVVNSFINTGVELGNLAAGPGSFNKLSIEDEFGQSGPYTDYYKRNTGLIEGAGLVVGSLLPGLGATKLLKLATATGRFSSEFSAATGLLSGIQDSAIKSAIGEGVENAAGTSLFGASTLAKIKAVGLGVGDAALQGAVYQTATLATMHASPLLDNNTWGENVRDIAESALDFGVLGGGLNAIATLKNIKQGVTALDRVSKFAENVETQGLGNITPGDRIVGLINGQKQIGARLTTNPSELTSTVIAKKQYSDNVVNRQLNSAFDDLTGGQDKDLSNAFGTFVRSSADNKIPISSSGAFDITPFAENFGQLEKIGRLDNPSIANTSSGVLYVPDKVDLGQLLKDHAGPDGSILPTAAKVLTSPTLGAPGISPLAKALTLKFPGTPLTIGHALEPDPVGLINLSNPSAPALQGVGLKYASIKDAFSKGVDLFIDSKGETHVNVGKSGAFQQVARPGESRVLNKAQRIGYTQTGQLPEGSKPLYTSALFQNLKDGTITATEPLPTVGDFKGGPTYTSRGLLVGEKGPNQQFFKFSAGNGEEFAPASPLAANAEYYWTAERGIQEGDTIHPSNLPQNEALYQGMKNAEVNFKMAGSDYLESKGISQFSDGSSIPETSQDLLQHIQQEKVSLALDLMQQGKGIDEISKITNTEPKVFSGGSGQLTDADWMVPKETNGSINHVRLAYNISNVGTTNGLQPQAENVLRGLQASNYRYQLAVQAASDYTANYAAYAVGPGQKAVNTVSALKVTSSPSEASLYGAGEGSIFAANGNYGTIQQQSERVGRQFQDLQLLRHAAVQDALTPSLVKIGQSPAAAAELNMFTFAQRSTAERYTFLPADLAQKYSMPENTVVLSGALQPVKDPASGKMVLDWNQSYLPNNFVDGAVNTGSQPALKNYYTLSKEVADVQRAHSDLLNTRNDLRDQWRQAQGLNPNGYNPSHLYPPPINTAQYPFFAFVKEREGSALSEGGAQVLVGKTEADLRNKIAQLPDHLVAYTRQDISEFKRAQGEYDWNRNFLSLKIKSDLASKGLLTGVVPDTRADTAINTFLDFHRRQETQLLRDTIELHNGKTFGQLEAMGERWIATANAKFGNNALKYDPTLAPDNPYASFARTALGVSSKDQYPLWNAAQDKLEAYAGTAFNAVRETFGALQKGIITPEEATKVAERFGLGNPYGNTIGALRNNYYGGLANRLPDPKILSKVIGTANSILGSTVIRMDMFQQLVHAVTLPIMAGLEHGGATKDLSDLLSVEVPGTAAAGKEGLQVPGFMRTMYNGIVRYLSPESSPPELRTIQENALNLPRDQVFQYRRMLDELSVPKLPTDSNTWLQKIKNAGDLAETLSGTKLVNQFNHHMATSIGYDIGKAKGLSGQALVDDISTFHNRVLGNLTAGQRGAIFHGPVGQAIGLFQSYYFNLLQQVFRHVEEGNGKALALGAGLQSTIFGLQSLPGFSHLNTLIQTSQGNSHADDLNTTIIKSLGPKVGDYLLYGALSGLTGAALFSRGDINPRHATLISPNPLDLPTVQAGIKTYTNIAKLASSITQGGNVPASLLLALEHNGLSRPLGGLAELMQGYSTDAKGNLISSPNGNNTAGFSDLFSVANMSRLLGARPLDEAIGLQTLYGSNANKAATEERLQSLGAAMRTNLYSSEQLDPTMSSDFAARYAAAGGRQEDFNRFMLDNINKAHNPAADKLFNHLSSDPRAQNAQVLMGGVPLPAYQPQGAGQEQTPDLSVPQ